MAFIADLITKLNSLRTTIGTKLNLLKAQIGLLPNLTTTNKNSLVEAINEVKSTTLASDPRYRRTSLTGASVSTVGIYKIVLGTAFSGWLKIRLSGSYSAQNSNGYVEVAGGVGANTGTQIWNNELVCITAIGQTAVVYYIDPVIKVDSAGNKYIEIHKKYSNANTLYLDIEFLSNSNVPSTYNPYIDSTIATTGVLTLTNKATVFGLKGSNTRMVTVNSLGELESQTIPANTTYSAGNGITQTGNTFSMVVNDSGSAGSGMYVYSVTQETGGIKVTYAQLPNGSYTLPTATSTVKGGVELFSDTVQTVAASAVTATASRTYGVQLNSAGQMVVNVPWSNTTYSLMTISELGTGTSTTARTINASVLNSYMYDNFVHKKGDNTTDPYSFKLRMHGGVVHGTAQGVAIVANDEAVEDIWDGRFDFSFEERMIAFNTSANSNGDSGFYISPTTLHFKNYASSAYINTEVASGDHIMNLPSCGTTSRTLVVGYDVGYAKYYAGINGMVNLPFGTFGSYNTASATNFYSINVYDAVVQNYTTNSSITLTTSGHGTVSGATITIIANESTAISLRIDTQVRKTNSNGTVVAANTTITIPARHTLILKRVTNIYYAQLIERVAW